MTVHRPQPWDTLIGARPVGLWLAVLLGLGVFAGCERHSTDDASQQADEAATVWTDGPASAGRRAADAPQPFNKQWYDSAVHTADARVGVALAKARIAYIGDLLHLLDEYEMRLLDEASRRPDTYQHAAFLRPLRQRLTDDLLGARDELDRLTTTLRRLSNPAQDLDQMHQDWRAAR